MAWFPVWQLLHFFAFIIYISMAVFILSRTSSSIRNPVNITAAALFMVFCTWSFGTIFLHNPGTPHGLAVLMDRIVTIAWMLFPSLMLLLFTLQSGNKKLLSSKLFYAALLLPPALCIFLFFSGRIIHAPEKTYFGWFSAWISGSPLSLVYFIYAPLYTACGALIFYFTARKAKSTALKRQAAIVGPFTLLVLLAGMFFDIIGPTYFYPERVSPLNSIADLYIAVWALAVFYSIVRYGMFSISIVTAADNIIANMSEALFLLDTDLKIIYANDAAHSILNYRDKELFSRYFTGLLKKKNDINTILKTALRQKSINGFETVMSGKTGSPVPVMVSFNVLFESGDIKGFSCIATDITNIKVAEFKLKHERDRAQKYLDTAEVMFLVLGRDHRIELINKKGCEILKCDENNIIGVDWIESFIPPEEKSDILDVFNRIIFDNSVSGDVENFIITKTGVKRLIRWSNSVLRSDSGDVKGILSAGIDITEQALNQEQIKKLSIAVEQSPSSIVITDAESNITYVNPKFCEISGYKREEVLGKNPRILQSGEWPREKYKELWDTIISGSQWRGEFHNKKKNGELYWESASISPIKDYKNITYAYIAIKEDITARKKAEDELKQSYQKLKELDILKTNFTSMVSHELRTPLTSIKGFLSLLLAGAAGKLLPQQKEFLDVIRNNSDRLLSLINEILDLSKMEAGSFTLDKNPCNLPGIIGKSITDIHSIADKKSIKIELESLIDNPVINADSYRISQVMINLINNAIKFSFEKSAVKIRIEPAGPGRIPFPAHFSPPAVSPGSICVSVADTGVGIKKDDLPKIFTRYYQAENINTRRFQGTGLGLSIAKNIVEAHGGCIWVDSGGEGKGSTLSFILPAS